MSRTYVPYTADVEQVPADEAETIQKIIDSMHRVFARTQEKYERPLRVSHAKSHGVATGTLEVLPDLPPHLRQGLFALPATYPVIVRLSNVPGELDPDTVSTQRGLAIKVLEVVGEPLPGHTGQTQDFVLDTGNRFASANAKQFLLTHSALEHAPQIPDAVKLAVSAVSRATNVALHAVGADSANLDFFGHAKFHPLAEAYFTQAPIRYGDYICKLGVFPIAAAQQALKDEEVDPGKDDNALRTATVDYLRDNDAVFEVRVQLCADLDKMPVENANVEWSEDLSPYVLVAHLRIPRQDAYSPARQSYMDDGLSFCVSHSLAAHRPLGSIMRARLRAYPEMSRLRREAAGQAVTEPVGIEAVPA